MWSKEEEEKHNLTKSTYCKSKLHSFRAAKYSLSADERMPSPVLAAKASLVYGTCKCEPETTGKQVELADLFIWHFSQNFLE